MIYSLNILTKLASQFERKINKLASNPITITSIDLKYHPHNTPFSSGVNYSLQGSVAGKIGSNTFTFSNLHKHIDSNSELDAMKFEDYQQLVDSNDVKEITPKKLAKLLTPKLTEKVELLGLVDNPRQFEQNMFAALTSDSGLEELNKLIDSITKHCYNARWQNHLSDQEEGFDLDKWFGGMKR